MIEPDIRDPATGARVRIVDDDGGGQLPAVGSGPKLLIRPAVLPTPSRAAVARRLSQAAAVTTRHLAPLVVRAARRTSVDDTAIALALRGIFDDMGGSFAKFGQLIGSSPSLFGDEVAAAFRSTLDAVPSVPFDQVEATVTDELGLALDDLFAEFDPEPLAAASLAVVHRAVLPDGRQVAVKILRPGIEHAMAVDLAVIGPLFGFLGRQVAIGIAGELPALVSGLAEQLAEEVDLRNEARSVRWFEHLRLTMGLDKVRVPLPIEGYVTKRVLVMDFFDGVAVDDTDAIEAMGIDPAPLVQDCVKAWFATAICTGAFHGDIHAGNLMVTTSGELGVIDWGIVGRMDAGTQQFFRRVIEGALGDEGAWADVWQHAKTIYGPTLQERLGVDDDVMAQMVRMQIEPLFIRPFGEVNLAELLLTPDIGVDDSTASAATGDERPAMSTFEMWRSERRRRREILDSGVTETSFDRGMFLLSKQLVYFDRYGKMFFPDVPVLWDTTAFERLLAEPIVPAS
jgi:predicted unusual protein kinase regulating ubiquinone biosynthesis (AarF/ABC1/UbiB family)